VDRRNDCHTLARGQDCGVLDQAGADEDAVSKGKSCHKSPIDVSDLTDVSP